MKTIYTESIQLIERLHRLFLDVVKTELDRQKIDDINNIQALILYNIGDEVLTIGELTQRGYYLGSNVSYNVKKLVDNGYLAQERALHDKRSIRIRVTNKGLALCRHIEAMYDRNVSELSKTMSDAQLVPMNKTLTQLESFWTSYIHTLHKLK